MNVTTLVPVGVGSWVVGGRGVGGWWWVVGRTVSTDMVPPVIGAAATVGATPEETRPVDMVTLRRSRLHSRLLFR